MDRVAVAALAARSAGEVPRIGSAAVTVLPDHVGQAGTLAITLVTAAVVRGWTDVRCRPQ